jgi:hypothetical protein
MKYLTKEEIYGKLDKVADKAEGGHLPDGTWLHSAALYLADRGYEIRRYSGELYEGESYPMFAHDTVRYIESCYQGCFSSFSQKKGYKELRYYSDDDNRVFYIYYGELIEKNS